MTSQPTSCLVVVLFGSNCSSGANDSKTKKQARRQGREEKKRPTSDDRIGKNLQGSSASKHHAAKKKKKLGRVGREGVEKEKEKRETKRLAAYTQSLVASRTLRSHTDFSGRSTWAKFGHCRRNDPSTCQRGPGHKCEFRILIYIPEGGFGYLLRVAATGNSPRVSPKSKFRHSNRSLEKQGTYNTCLVCGSREPYGFFRPIQATGLSNYANSRPEKLSPVL